MPVLNPTLSYPKPRNTITKVIPIARTDSSTVKCWLPKDAVVSSVEVLQTTDAVTGAGSFVLGWAGATTALLTAFSMATTKVGLVKAGTAVGALVATKLDSDKAVIATYTVGASTAGGVGFVIIEYFVPGPGELVDD